jgi:molybdenum cofactor synthesis domain-containing protein
MRAAVLTISDSRAAGDAEDESGKLLVSYAESLGLEVFGREVVPDERELIEERLRHWADEGGCSLILTTGGTGFAPRDVTPEATRAVIEREAPGLAEAMRIASREHTDLWMVSRGVAGVRGATLIVNFPGAPKSIPEAGEGVRQAIPHALNLLSGEAPHWPGP